MTQPENQPGGWQPVPPPQQYNDGAWRPLGGQPPQMPPPAPKKKTGKRLGIIIGAVTVIVIGCCIGSIALSGGDKKGDKQVETTQGAPAVRTTGAAAPVTTAPAPAKPAAKAPAPADFKLTVKELEKQCFGSAGCNLQFRISKVAYTGPELDPDATYEVSYAYKGLSDPMTGTFTLQGDGSYEVAELEFGQTKRSSVKVTAIVTAVEKL